MITPKTPEEIALMQTGGRKLAVIMQELLTMAQPGVSLLDLEAHAMKRIGEEGATPSFTTVAGYKWATCLCINEQVVHGIPTKYPLREGDLLTIDMGLIYGGFHVDHAWSKIVTSGREKYEEKERFLAVGQDALKKAIAQARVGNRVGNISEVVQKTIEGAGYSVVKTLVGHGVGRTLHEDPQVPNFLRGAIESTPQLVEGLTVALEPIYALGRGEIVYDNDDGWTLATEDRSWAGQFEHTIAITKGGPIVLTQP